MEFERIFICAFPRLSRSASGNSIEFWDKHDKFNDKPLREDMGSLSNPINQLVERG